MNRLKRFYKQFGAEPMIEEENKKFVNRINQTLIKDLHNSYDYERLFHSICYSLGENSADIIKDHNRFNPYGRTKIPSLRILSGDNLYKTMEILVAAYEYFKKDEEWKLKIEEAIKSAMGSSLIELGFRWKQGTFYKAGATILDEKLIEDPYEWLAQYPDEKKEFEEAIISLMGKKYNDSVISCYLVIEGLVRKILSNRKTLENNIENILKNLKLSQSWKSILKNYIDYANEFRRHASDNRNKIDPAESEAYLYLTGLIVRLLIEHSKE